MTRRRWIADEVSGNHAALVGEHARHLAQVLRAQIGQEFEIATGREVHHATVTNVRADRIEFQLGETVTQASGVNITIALSIFKFDRMEWAIEKCTELGVQKIIPIIAARTEPHLAAASQKRVERWRRIVQQASEQSRRDSVPEITAPVPFSELVSMRVGLRLFLSEFEKKNTLKDAVANSKPDSVLLAFGPEGGWKEQEASAFIAHGWTSASLGQTILRAETAAIAAVAITASVLTS